MMDNVVMIFGHPIQLAHLLIGASILMLVLLLAIFIQLVGYIRSCQDKAYEADERARELDAQINEMHNLQSQMTGRMQTVAEIFGTRQNDLARFVSERIDGLQHRVGQSLETSSHKTLTQLSSLSERLALIDAAQKNLSDLTVHVVGLKDVLANKQSRGAFGQGRMEAIIRDGLPPSAYQFQATLRNGKRPDCLVSLPGDAPLVIDAKFPLEGITAFRDTQELEDKKRAAMRVRNDIALHIRDIAEKYLVPGETQNMALLFVPSESIYADLHEHFDDVVQKAHRARVIIVSPSLLAMAIQLVQSLVRDARMREEAQTIQVEVRRMLDDVKRLRDRVEKLDTHFRQAQDDIGQIRTSSEKVARRGENIASLEFEENA